MTAEVRRAKIALVLIAVPAVVIFVPGAAYRLGSMSYTFEAGYSRGAQRDASLLEALTVWVVFLFLIYLAGRSVTILVRHYWARRRRMSTWTFEGTVGTVLILLLIILLLLVRWVVAPAFISQ